VILYVGNFLSKHGYTPTSNEALVPLLKKNYIVFSTSSKRSIILRLLSMVGTFFLKRKKVKVVIIDFYSKKGFWYGFIISQLCIRYGIKFIPVIHGGDFEKRLLNSKKTCAAIFSRAFRIISPSMYMKVVFADNGYECTYIPNFLNIERYTFHERKKIDPNILWVRSFHQIYNPELAIDVMNLFLKKYPKAQLCMVGPDKDGYLAKSIERAEKYAIQDQITFTGKLTKKDWIELSKNYDVFINTTRIDNHPVSLVEAMALGLVVISTSVGGIPYLIENGKDGFLVSQNAEEFVEQIDYLIKHPQEGLIVAQNARKKVEEFDWENVKQSWFTLIEEARNS